MVMSFDEKHKVYNSEYLRLDIVCFFENILQ